MKNGIGRLLITNLACAAVAAGGEHVNLYEVERFGGLFRVLNGFEELFLFTVVALF
jgi:hypothetical protein